MSSEPTIFKRAQVRDPNGQIWHLIVEDRLDPTHAKLARDAAERYGRYTMTIVAPNGKTAQVLQDANTVQTDAELARYQGAITSGAWGAELLAEPATS